MSDDRAADSVSADVPRSEGVVHDRRGPSDGSDERIGTPADRSGAPRDWRSGTQASRPLITLHEWTLRDTGKVVAIAVAAALFLVPTVLLMQKRDLESAIAAQQASAYTPPPLSTVAGVTHRGPVIAIVGDETSVSAATGVSTAKRWPALLSATLDSDVEVTRALRGGYATRGTDGVTFVTAASDVPSNADVVLIVGGSHDAAVSAAALSKAATEAVAAASGRATQAAVVLVGPFVGDGSSSSTLRNALAAGAAAAGVRWVDPISSTWLPSLPAGAADLSAADELAISKRLATVVRQLAR